MASFILYIIFHYQDFLCLKLKKEKKKKKEKRIFKPITIEMHIF